MPETIKPSWSDEIRRIAAEELGDHQEYARHQLRTAAKAMERALAERDKAQQERDAVLDWAVNFGSSLEWHTTNTKDGPRFAGCSAMGPTGRREHADTPIAAIRVAAGLDSALAGDGPAMGEGETR